MHLCGSRGQIVRDFMYDASGTITTGGTPQLVLPERMQNSSIYLENISSGSLWFEFGGARATCTISSGAVASFTITNAGFGYTVPPRVHFYGGGDSTKNPNYLCPGLPGLMSPSKAAKAHAVLSGDAVTSIVIDDPGANYVKAPFVFLRSSEQDPYGAAIPSATNGVLLVATGGAVTFNGTVCTTDAISVFGATTGQGYTCKYTIGG